MVRKRSELASPATATGALWGPRASRYEVVRYPAAGVAPAWHELHCAAKSGAMSSSQLTACVESPWSGRAFEQADAASARTITPSSARMGASGRPVGMHQADGRDPVGTVADQALLPLSLGGCGCARFPVRSAIRLHVVDRRRCVVARGARSDDRRIDERRGGWLGADPGGSREAESGSVIGAYRDER